MGTVVGIIDGTGSLGAALGQIIVNFYNKTNLFYIDRIGRGRRQLGLHFWHNVRYDTPEQSTTFKASDPRDQGDIYAEEASKRYHRKTIGEG
jgi:hypothetical protein